MSQPMAIVTDKDRHGPSSGFGGQRGGARKAWEDCETQLPLSPPKTTWHGMLVWDPL